MTAVYNRTQLAFTLAMLSELGAGLSSEGAAADLYRIIAGELALLSPSLGEWTVTWGPAVQMITEYVGAQPVPVNTAFVAYCPARKQIAVIVAGTNPYSWFDWWVEDWQIGRLVPWTLGREPAGDAAISAGSATGLEIVHALRPVAGLPATATSLGEHLALLMPFVPGEVEVMASGHSLGGALAPALALELEATRGSWDPAGRATVSVITFAAPTTGNAAFAALVERSLPGRIERVHNRLDTSPLGWTPSLLANCPSLYAPEVPVNSVTELLLEYRARQAAQAVVDANANGLDGGPYAHVDPTRPPLEGRFRIEVSPRGLSSYARFNQQAEYQHTDAYFGLLGLVDAHGYTTRMKLAHVTRRTVGHTARLGLAVARATAARGAPP